MGNRSFFQRLRDSKCLQTRKSQNLTRRNIVLKNTAIKLGWIDGKKSGKNMLNQNTSECSIEKENSITLIWCPWEQVKKSKLKKQSRQKASLSIRRIFGKLKKTLREEKNRPKINKKQRIEKSDFKRKMRRSRLTSRRRRRDLKLLVKRPLEVNL